MNTFHIFAVLICVGCLTIAVSGKTTDSPAIASLGRHGLLLITKNGKTGTVCNDDFDDRDAKVVCRMLGFPSENAKALELGRAKKGGPKSLRIVLDNVRCSGSEPNIEDCRHRPFWAHDCSHAEDIGVSCEPESTTGKPETACEVYKNRGYEFNKKLRTFTDAQKDCYLSGASLTSIKDIRHNKWIDKRTGRVGRNKKWWVGINDIEKEGEFINSDGSPVIYTNWASGEPNNADNEDCVSLRRFSNTAKWNDARCYYRNYYICEYPTATCLKNSGLCDTSFRGMSHMFIRLARNWHQAQSICRSMDMDLVTVEDFEHLKYLKNKAFGLEKRWWWIGLNDIKEEGKFEWSNGSNSTYREFRYDEPNAYEPGEDCVHMGWNEDYRWNDQSCFSTAHFICAKKGYFCNSST